MDNLPSKDETAPEAQPEKPYVPDHTPQNSYGSQQPFKLASSRQPVLIVLCILLVIALGVIGYFIFITK